MEGKWEAVAAHRSARHRANVSLRLVVGSTAAIALLVACAFTTMRGRNQAGVHAGKRLEGDKELAHYLELDGLAPYVESDGVGPLSIPVLNSPVRSLPRRVEESSGSLTVSMLPETGVKPLEIKSWYPTSCAAIGGCVIAFAGQNIVAAAGLEGQKANTEMSVTLSDAAGAIVSNCTDIQWTDDKNFRCKLSPAKYNPGLYDRVNTVQDSTISYGLRWTVSIPSTSQKWFNSKDRHNRIISPFNIFTFPNRNVVVKDIKPLSCQRSAACLITFTGSNFAGLQGYGLASRDRPGETAEIPAKQSVNDLAMSVYLADPATGVNLVNCSDVVFLDNLKFTCRLASGIGISAKFALAWTVTISRRAAWNYFYMEGGSNSQISFSDATWSSMSRQGCKFCFNWEKDYVFPPVRIAQIEPSECGTAGGCVISFTGKNIIAAQSLEGNAANDAMIVFLYDISGKTRFDCTAKNWIDSEHFECTVGAGMGTDLLWNVSIPSRSAYEGWTWTSYVRKQVCSSFCFHYLPPTVTLVEPAVLNAKQNNIIKIHGTNFGKSPANITVLFNNINVKNIELESDNVMRVQLAPVNEPGIIKCQVTVGEQQTQFNIPVKVTFLKEKNTSNFTSQNTFRTEQWNITMAAMISQTGVSSEWFESHQTEILAFGPAQPVDVIMQIMHIDSWYAVAVQLFRHYLESHFAANDAGHKVMDADGVYILNLGNTLNGDEEHDQKVLLKQLQVMEAETGESRSKLAHFMGDVVRKEPPCSGYPDCRPADSVGHRGWTWHWNFDVKREEWSWEYLPISDGSEPPISCAYCDPVKMKATHDSEFIKQRLENCMSCVRDKFRYLDTCKCADFKAMCLQEPANMPGLRIAGHVDSDSNFTTLVASSSPLVDPPFIPTECSVQEAATRCSMIGGVPSADGLLCCPSSCAVCGGDKCGRDCCADSVTSSAVQCGSGAPPCVFASAESNITDRQNACANVGGVLDAASLQCCAAECGKCGGQGCETRPGGADRCCLDNIISLNKMCSKLVQAPCTLKNGGGPHTLPFTPSTTPLEQTRGGTSPAKTIFGEFESAVGAVTKEAEAVAGGVVPPSSSVPASEAKASPSVPASDSTASPSVPVSDPTASPSVPASDPTASPSVPASETTASPSEPASETAASPSLPSSETTIVPVSTDNSTMPAEQTDHSTMPAEQTDHSTLPPDEVTRTASTITGNSTIPDGQVWGGPGQTGAGRSGDEVNRKKGILGSFGQYLSMPSDRMVDVNHDKVIISSNF
jgi:hypothetical protein